MTEEELKRRIFDLSYYSFDSIEEIEDKCIQLYEFLSEFYGDSKGNILDYKIKAFEYSFREDRSVKKVKKKTIKLYSFFERYYGLNNDQFHEKETVDVGTQEFLSKKFGVSYDDLLKTLSPEHVAVKLIAVQTSQVFINKQGTCLQGNSPAIDKDVTKHDLESTPIIDFITACSNPINKGKTMYYKSIDGFGNIECVLI